MGHAPRSVPNADHRQPSVLEHSSDPPRPRASDRDRDRVRRRPVPDGGPARLLRSHVQDLLDPARAAVAGARPGRHAHPSGHTDPRDPPGRHGLAATTRTPVVGQRLHRDRGRRAAAAAAAHRDQCPNGRRSAVAPGPRRHRRARARLPARRGSRPGTMLPTSSGQPSWRSVSTFRSPWGSSLPPGPATSRGW